MNQIIPTAEPFFFPGKPGQPACLLTHGFTGAPKEMRWMGEYLNREHGFTCLGMRLTGHATKPEDMIRSRYTDWIASVEDGYHVLSGLSKRIYLIGLSMGGMLSLHAAAKFPAAGVIAMATPYGLPDDWRMKVINLLSRIRPYLPKGKNAPGATWFDKESYAQHVSYPQNPVRSISELKKLTLVLQAALPEVTAPALLIYSKDDIYLPLGSENSMQAVYNALGSTHKEKHLLEGSGHVLTRDARRETVFKLAADFIQRIEANS